MRFGTLQPTDWVADSSGGVPAPSAVRASVVWLRKAHLPSRSRVPAPLPGSDPYCAIKACRRRALCSE